jgi:hypothetical protein
MEHWEGDGHDCGVFELPDAVRQLYRNDVADMAANGITMRVWRKSIALKLPPCLLFPPGFEKLWPQWSDVSDRFSREAIIAAWVEEENGVKDLEDNGGAAGGEVEELSSEGEELSGEEEELSNEEDDLSDEEYLKDANEV